MQTNIVMHRRDSYGQDEMTKAKTISKIVQRICTTDLLPFMLNVYEYLTIIGLSFEV